MRNLRIRAAATVIVAAGFTAGLTGSAQAQTGYTDGSIRAAVEFKYCQGYLQFGTSNTNGSTYARGVFYLPYSSRSLPCVGWVQRSTDGGSTWSDISDRHTTSGGSDVTTYYYYDGADYLARVCVGDFLHSNSYSCSPGW
jgi:hypothetical protein